MQADSSPLNHQEGPHPSLKGLRWLPQPVHGTPRALPVLHTRLLLILSLTHPLLNIRIPCFLVSKPLLTLLPKVTLFLTAKSHLSCKAHCSQERSRKLAIPSEFFLIPSRAEARGATGPPLRALVWKNLSARGEGCSLSESRGEHRIGGGGRGGAERGLSYLQITTVWP